MVRYSGRSSQRRAAIRTAAAGGALGLLATALGAAPAAADTGVVNYTCSASILTNQAFTATARGTAPATATVGEAIGLSDFSADVTVNSSATGTLYWFIGARSVTGTAALQIAAEGTGLAAAPANVQVPATPVPSSGELTVRGTGPAPTFTPTAPGTVRFQAGNFTAALVTTNANGGTSNIPVNCTLNPGQDTTIASTTVLAAS